MHCDYALRCAVASRGEIRGIERAKTTRAAGRRRAGGGPSAPTPLALDGQGGQGYRDGHGQGGRGVRARPRATEAGVLAIPEASPRPGSSGARRHARGLDRTDGLLLRGAAGPALPAFHPDPAPRTHSLQPSTPSAPASPPGTVLPPRPCCRCLPRDTSMLHACTLFASFEAVPSACSHPCCRASHRPPTSRGATCRRR